MSNKPTSGFGFPGDDDLFDDAASVVDQITDYLQQGKTTQAKSLLSRRWRDLVPGLPLRFSVVLDSPGEKNVLAIAKAMKNGQAPPTLLLKARSKKHGGYYVASEEGKKLGDLPSRDAEFLRSIGDDSSLYVPDLLEIRTREKGKLDLIAVELVRPEIHSCSSCGKRHSSPHANCDDCRSKRRKIEHPRPESEGATVPFHEALDALQTAEMNREEENNNPSSNSEEKN
jgi:hypothetical protein